MKKQKRMYRLARRRVQKMLTVGILGCAVVFAVCSFLLIRYGLQYRKAQEASRELRDIYRAETAAPAEAAESTVPATPVPATAAPSMAPAATPFTAPQMTLAPWSTAYPLNPYLAVRSPFVDLQKKNPDIVGWLTIGGLLDEAVVQRDNEYYLKQDYLKRSNDNGALFLDEGCSLKSRPPLYVVYGHNMKSGAMFGKLHDYEHLSYYREHPFLTFNTQYENGEFVIFSVCDLPVSVIASALNLYNRMDTQKYLDFIREVQVVSIYTSVLPMNEQDQLLLLVTCTGNDDTRRVVAARRLRDSERREDVAALIREVRNK